MAVTFVNVKIARLIVHEIFGRNPQSPVRAPNLSQHCTDIEGNARATFLDRLTKALGAGSSCVEMEVQADGADSVYQLGLELLSSPDEPSYVEISGTIASLLYQAQTSAAIPGGVVIVFSGTLGSENRPFFAIIKAEVQEGFRTRVEEEGRLELELISDLFLTPQQKLYKIGVFVSKKIIVPTTPSPKDFEVYVYDSNILHNESANAAKYFAEAFLGCVVPQTSKYLTKKFFEITKHFIDSHEDFDDVRRVDLKGALFTYLKVATTSTISFSDFSDQFLKAKEKQTYSKHMQGEGFPNVAVKKDTSLIDKTLKSIRIFFTSGVQISVPGVEPSKVVKVIDAKENSTIIEIQGRLSTRLKAVS